MAEAQEPEYHVIIGPATDPESGSPCLSFDVRTVREFTSFGYTITVKMTKAPSEKGYRLEVGGISLPKVGRPQPGPARTVLLAALPPNGTYQLTVARKKQMATCAFTVGNAAPGKISSSDPGGLATFEVASS